MDRKITRFFIHANLVLCYANLGLAMTPYSEEPFVTVWHTLSVAAVNAVTAYILHRNERKM
jgi:hypothetical protein